MNQNPILPDDPRLTAYALNEMEPAERVDFETLLRQDEAARQAVEEIRATGALLATALEHEPAPAPGMPAGRAAIVPGGPGPVLDGGGRAATTTFAQRNIGDALATFESEVPLIKREFGQDFEVIYPSVTVLAENPVSVVDKVVDKKGTRKQAEAYPQYLYSDEGQAIAVKHNLRPRSPALLKQHQAKFIGVPTFTVDEVFGGWGKVQAEHFRDGGIYDQITTAGRK